MLKEVGASGRISLGKKYAGRLFDVIVPPGDRFEPVPKPPVIAHVGAFEPAIRAAVRFTTFAPAAE